MIPNCDITVFNKYVDANRAEQYLGTVVLGVVAWGPHGMTQGRDGQMRENVRHFQVQQSRMVGYMDHTAWRALPDNEKPAYWTLQMGDYIVGQPVADIVDAEFTIGDLKDKYDEVYIIDSFDVMNQGSLSLRHCEVEAR